MIRLIVWAFIIYFIIKIARYVIRTLSGTSEKNETIRDGRTENDSRKPYSIDKKDIVDADFTEIKEDKDKKTGE